MVASNGARPTITRTGPGVYSFSIDLGGIGCPLVQLTPYGHSNTMYWYGGSCGGSRFSTTVHVTGGQDAAWIYQIVGFDSSSEAGALGETAIEFTAGD